MPTKEPAAIGMAVDEISTPALLIDLDAFEHNLTVMAAQIQNFGVRLRPHAKTHKCAAIARRQMELGAIGSCCQTVREAEALAGGGINNLLVSNQVVGADKIARLVELAKHTTLGVCVDHEDNVAALSNAAHTAGCNLNVLVEIDIGMGRCGVAPGKPALRLAQKIVDSPGLTFEGVQAYHGGAQHIRKFEERRDAIRFAADTTAATVALLADNEISCQTVAGAGTGTYEFEATSGVYNELQAGSYVFMDADYVKNQTEKGENIDTFNHALFVLTSVISTPNAERAIVDAGLKSHSVDSGLPTLMDFPEIDYVGASDEHGNLDLSRSNHRFALGDKLKLVPGHCDPTVNLYDWYIGVRGSTVELIWQVDGRGPGN